MLSFSEMNPIVTIETTSWQQIQYADQKLYHAKTVYLQVVIAILLPVRLVVTPTTEHFVHKLIQTQHMRPYC